MERMWARAYLVLWLMWAAVTVSMMVQSAISPGGTVVVQGGPLADPFFTFYFALWIGIYVVAWRRVAHGEAFPSASVYFGALLEWALLLLGARLPIALRSLRYRR